MRLVTLGDLLVDVVVALERPFVLGDDTSAETRLSAGGQAANVAAWAATLGCETRFVGRRGSDAAAALAVSELEHHGVEVVGPSAGRTGIVVSLSNEGDRSMISDRGTATDLRPDDLQTEWFRCEKLHLSGYALMREPIAHAAWEAVRIARSHGATISIDLSSWTAIDDAFRRVVYAVAPDTVFATAKEQEAFGSLETRWVVKLGALGVSVDGVIHPAHETEVVDTTGAGDAFAGGYLVGGIDAGLETAARCCAKLGAMP